MINLNIKTNISSFTAVTTLAFDASPGSHTLKIVQGSDGIVSFSLDDATKSAGDFLFVSKMASVNIGRAIYSYGDISTNGAYYPFTGDTDVILNFANAQSFNVLLEKNSAEKNRIDKTGFVTPVLVASGVLRTGVDITDPVIDIEVPSEAIGDVLTSFNYAYVEHFKRYYFVDKVSTTATKNSSILRLSLHCDVLFTFMDEILKCKGRIIRTNDEKYNDVPYYSYADDEAIRPAETLIEDYVGDTDVFSNDAGNGGYVIQINSMGGL